jgi:hypothetical protein
MGCTSMKMLHREKDTFHITKILFTQQWPYDKDEYLEKYTYKPLEKFYMRISFKNVKLEEKEGKLWMSILEEIIIYGPDGEIVEESIPFDDESFVREDYDPEKHNNLINPCIIPLNFESGDYIIEITITDRFANVTDTASKNFKVVSIMKRKTSI